MNTLRDKNKIIEYNNAKIFTKKNNSHTKRNLHRHSLLNIEEKF